MTGPLKLVVRFKPKQTPSNSQQEPTTSTYSGGKPVKQRKREDSRHSTPGQRVPAVYNDSSPPFPPAKKHKRSSDSIVGHESSSASLSAKPPKLQLKLSAPQSGSSQGAVASRSVLEKPSSSSDGGLSLRLSIPKLPPNTGISGSASASKAGVDAHIKKRKPDAQNVSLPHSDSAGLKKLKLLSANSTLASPAKQAPKAKPTRSKGTAAKKGWEASSQSLATALDYSHDVESQQDVESSPRPSLLKGDATAASKPAPFADVLPVEPPTRNELEKLVDKIQKKDASDIFREPVTEAIAPGYFSVITKPMDFTTIRRNISDGVYLSWDALEEDVTVMFNNAMTYNTQDTPYYKQARTLLDVSRKLLELARQGVTNFRGRTAGIVRAHNAKIAAEERAEKEAQLAAMKAEKLAVRKVVDKNGSSGLKTVALNSIAADRAPSKAENDAPKPRNNARPIVRENDGRRPLHNDENMRVSYKPLAEVSAAKWGLLVNGASAEGLVYSSDSHHVRLQQHQVSRDGYLTSMARFVLNCSKNVQEYVLNKVVDCVPVESVLPKPVLGHMSSRVAAPDVSKGNVPQPRQQSNAPQQQFSGLAIGGTYNADKPSGDAAPHRLTSLQGSHTASNNLHALQGRLPSGHSLQSVLPGGGGVHHGPGMLYATTPGPVQQVHTLGSRGLQNFASSNKGAGNTTSTVMSSQALYQPVPGGQAGAGFPNMYNIGNLPYFGTGQVVQNLSKSHDLLRQG